MGVDISMYMLSVGLFNAIKSPSKFEKRLKSSVILYKISVSLSSYFSTFFRVILIFILLPITVLLFTFLHCFPKLSRSLGIYIY